MRICGLNKTTLLDYPGRVAATIFLGGCNFRCPFCQNGALVLRPSAQQEIPQEEVLAFLKKRQGILEGICVSGGEPTLSPELPSFLEKIRALGYEIKLDTNGSHPDVVKDLARDGLIQQVAMDIKAGRGNYGRLIGAEHPDLAGVEKTAAFLLGGGLPYEFRTTVVKELHSAGDFWDIRSWLSGAEAYYLQGYRDSQEVISPGYSACSREEMEAYREILAGTMKQVELRGME